ncbi:MAG: DinB family protein [Gemmatimonadales bacterium]
MDPRVTPLADILRLNTRLFRNCLQDLTDEQARMRPSPTTNSAAFVAAHLAESRYFLLKLLGAERPSPLDRYLSGWKSIEQIQEWPTLAQVRDAWTEASHALRDRLDAMTAAELDAPNPTRFPVREQTVLGVLGFLVQHESYHVGQLSLLRKYVGLPAMSYM